MISVFLCPAVAYLYGADMQQLHMPSLTEHLNLVYVFFDNIMSWATNQHIRMISEGSCDTKEWSNGCWIFTYATHHWNLLHFFNILKCYKEIVIQFWMLLPNITVFLIKYIIGAHIHFLIYCFSTCLCKPRECTYIWYCVFWGKMRSLGMKSGQARSCKCWRQQ